MRRLLVGLLPALLAAQITAYPPGDGAGAVKGAEALTTVGAIPFVTSAGVLGQDVAVGTAFYRDPATGNVGIGTTGPPNKLSVLGAVGVYGGYTDASNYFGGTITSTDGALTIAAVTAGTGADAQNVVLTPAGEGFVSLGGAGYPFRVHGDGYITTETPNDTSNSWNTYNNGSNNVARVTGPSLVYGFSAAGLYQISASASVSAGSTVTLLPLLSLYQATGNLLIGTTDDDGTPATARLVAQGSTNDGSTNIFVGRDSDGANVLSVDTNGIITPAGYKSSDGSAGVSANCTAGAGPVEVKNGIIVGITCL